MARPRFNLLSRFDTLRQLGVAVEYFPKYRHTKLGLHFLDVVLMTFLLRGRGRHYIEDQSFAEDGPSIAVTHYGQRHDIVTQGSDMDILNIYADLRSHPPPSLPPRLQRVLPMFLPIHPGLAHRQNRIVRLKVNDPAPLAELLFALRDEQQRRAAGYEESIALLWRLFLIRCCRLVLEHGIETPPDLSPAQEKIETLRQYLDQHCAKPHTLEALSRRAGMTRTSLCRAFKAHTGKRVFDYLISRRVQAAMMALRSSDDKIMSIALSCGFADLAYFNRTFKRIAGQTPRQYRTSCRL